MKRAIVIIIIIAVAIGAGVWRFKLRAPADAAHTSDKPAEQAQGAHVTHDEQGNTVVEMSDDEQGDAGIVVGNPLPGQWSQEVKGHGRVMDPSPLAALVNELVSARAAASATAAEWERQKTLSAQNNTSARAAQAAEAAAQRDRLAEQSVRDRLTLAWGVGLAGRGDLADFVQLLVARQAALVRVDLPGGESLAAQPAAARVVALSGATSEAKFLSRAVEVDPQTQGEGFIFFVQSQTNALAPGQSGTAWLEMPGVALAGVILPRDSVVRVEGAGWVYIMKKDKGGEAFTRTRIQLDRPTGGGWFVTEKVKSDDYVVVRGAQTLLSEELKAALSPD